MSEIFHAAAAGEPYEMPIGPEATMWMMSAQRAAQNLLHAAFLPETDGKPLTLPALRITALELATALYGQLSLVTYHPDAGLQARFGAFPPLRTPVAEGLGFVHDGNLTALIAATRGEA